MRHGFKAQAERLSISVREDLGQGPHDPLAVERYAERLGVVILTFAELEISAASKKQLLVADPESWSGMTIKINGLNGVLVNPEHAPERWPNTIMHELAHISLGHVATRVDVGPDGILLVSDFSQDDEDEADWLAGALLLPRDALRHFRGLGQSAEDIARDFGVSRQLCEWRLRMTGVDIQLRRGGRLTR
ncbi:ImmA/IrrE family metallo-endopeptidase [uncultured Rhodoblastus sp.]|uniref:ImmA/IrrE family metallo-endopeptidase n=1 Tax=uncultured Rhodoblastus sp. TaxID=543037 RepID=UPI0025F2267D|nr:ImmA/IrrE family metallo-endopeptidase [uncultured Rhodoblastus sp.]